MVALIAAADPQPGGGYAPAAQALEPRLETPQSGVYAQIRSSAHGWRSPSTAGITGDFGALLPHGERSLTYADFDHDRVAIESRAIQFEEGAAESGTYTFSVAVSLAPYEQQLWQFRRQLLGWFSGLLLALLVTLAALLRWVLAPLRRMDEIHAVEEGAATRSARATRANSSGWRQPQRPLSGGASAGPLRRLATRPQSQDAARGDAGGHPRMRPRRRSARSTA